MQAYFPTLVLAGLALALIGFVGLVVVAWTVRPRWGIGVLVFPPIALIFISKYSRPSRNPLLIFVFGLLMAAFPPLYTRLIPPDLGPRLKVVEGERHVTLTGWDRKDYEILGRLPDVTVLQMANPDVTDETLKLLKGMASLRELDLNGSKVTDDGIKSLGGLTKLERLRLRDTGVTDRGFSESLAPMESLKELDLRGTAVDRERVRGWKEAKPGRRALQ